MGRIIGFIPVRAGSKSIPHKNIRPFNGQPLLYWVARALSSCERVDEVFVATDGEDIAAVVESLHLPKVAAIGRSASTATDSASTESALLEFIDSDHVNADDLVILVQATSPLLTALDIDRGIDIMEASGRRVSVVSGVRTKRFFWTTEGEPLNYDYRSRPRRQDFDGVFMENGAFYISSARRIAESQCRISAPIAIAEMPESTAIELDEPEDWIAAERLMQFAAASNRTQEQQIRAVLMDVDGVLTDCGMLYSENGDELKTFNTRDGMAVEMAKRAGIVTGILTSENTEIVKRRARKMGVDYLFQGVKGAGKLEAARKICVAEGISLAQVAYIGDDVNCGELLRVVGLPACPSDAAVDVLRIPGIQVMGKTGGKGVVRELLEMIISRNLARE